MKFRHHMYWLAIVFQIFGFNFAFADEILLKCDVTEAASGKLNGEEFRSQSVTNTSILKFYQENVEIEPQIMDFTKQPPLFKYNKNNKELRWVVNKDGLVIKSPDEITINDDGTMYSQHFSVVVNDETLSYVWDSSHYDKKNENNLGNSEMSFGHKMVVGINRITGSITGEMIEFNHKDDTNLITKYVGKCEKGNKKF